MFWALLFSHLIADYPLQTDGLVRAKKTCMGLLLHVAIHLATMCVVLFGVLDMPLSPALPAVLAVTMCHLGIDIWKNVLARLKPQWVIGGYLQDQVLHLVSITLAAAWYAHTCTVPLFALPAQTASAWLLPASGYVLVTHAWFVTERVLSYRAKAYQEWLQAHLWPRLMSRTILFSVWLLGGTAWGAIALLGALTLHWYDLGCRYRWRALGIDLAVVVGIIPLLYLAHLVSM